MRRIQEIKEPYKLEILDDISRKHPDEPITIYHVGQPGSPGHWWDLCAGPHVATTGDINPAAVDLESVAGGCPPAQPWSTPRTYLHYVYLHSVLVACGASFCSIAVSWILPAMHEFEAVDHLL